MPAFQRIQVNSATCTSTPYLKKAFVPFFQNEKKTKGSLPFVYLKALCHFYRIDKKTKGFQPFVQNRKKEKALCHFFRIVNTKGFLSFLQKSLFFFLSTHQRPFLHFFRTV